MFKLKVASEWSFLPPRFLWENNNRNDNINGSPGCWSVLFYPLLFSLWISPAFIMISKYSYSGFISPGESWFFLQDSKLALQWRLSFKLTELTVDSCFTTTLQLSYSVWVFNYSLSSVLNYNYSEYDLAHSFLHVIWSHTLQAWNDSVYGISTSFIMREKPHVWIY